MRPLRFNKWAPHLRRNGSQRSAATTSERRCAGIRHHHERWDGQGYLDRLAGESIPRIARILAVADAFSAMTTTRPYRKALDVREAMARLADAAGTQLDERLVAAFLEGMEQDADPPLPGEASTAFARPRWVA